MHARPDPAARSLPGHSPSVTLSLFYWQTPGCFVYHHHFRQLVSFVRASRSRGGFMMATPARSFVWRWMAASLLGIGALGLLTAAEPQRDPEEALRRARCDNT